MLKLMSPSKTHGKIYISKLLLHSVRECVRFIDFKPPGLLKSEIGNVKSEIRNMKADISNLESEICNLKPAL